MSVENKIIAEFMGGEHPLAEVTHEAHHNYHTSWDWLMPVIKKCKSLDNTFDVEYEVVNEDYHAVVEFIKQLKQ